ncbi:peptidase, M16 family protein [unidentified eubacterium SCB49]|nr:peptidase, M16 family protein [unidentified eubacterium SCB49]
MVMKLTTFMATAIIATTFFSCESDKKMDAKKETEFTLDYEKFTLDNGLDVILHVDKSDPIVAVATVMHVGSNREVPGKTGFAHFFEHMAFNDSENVPVGANRKMIPEWGGSRNGGTWSDGTIYYEVVPKDAFEKILWIDSDRFGYMINTVTTAALEREKQVVKNEKRQRVDNAPYGYTDEIIRKNLYPEGHPYSWTVIGALPDLQAATLDDVKEFYHQYYGAANGSLVIAGDIDIEETKKQVQKWFGEIPSGPEVAPLKPMPVTLEKSKSLSFEDNFAKLPELRMVFPTVENYNKDSYALQVLGQLLSGSKKAALYKTIVEEKKLAPNAGSYQNSNELAGEFIIRVRANEGVDLDEVKEAIETGLLNFETNGFTDNELERIKAELETRSYSGIATVLNKAFQLVNDNEFAGDPEQTIKDTEIIKNMTREEVMRVYNTYIKDQHYVMTSVVPKGNIALAVSDSEEASIWIEEVGAMAASEEVSQGEEAVYEKTPSTHDRSEPAFGDAPLIKMPAVWTGKMENGLGLFGIENNELPLVNFNIIIPGGHKLDPAGKAGVASLMADLMNEGTANMTSAALEEAIGLLGSSIYIGSGSEDLVISGSCLSRNFEKTMTYVEEMLLQPRWDEKEFDRLKKELETSLKGREANPTAIAALNFNKLIYGDNHSYGVPTNGTLESVKNITLEDVKAFYKNLSPKGANFHVVGSVDETGVKKALQHISENWNGEAIVLQDQPLPKQDKAGNLYFIDVPNSKQSVLYIGKIAVNANDKDAKKLDYSNEILGGGSSGRLFQTLRISKGYTYGAYSRIPERAEKAAFTINSSVRANATLPSLKIIEEMLQTYGTGFTEEDVTLTKNKIIKANTRAFESFGAKLGMLNRISKYGRSLDYVDEDQTLLTQMQLEDFKTTIANYMAEEDMVYLVVGDKATQLEEVKKLGKKVIELDIYGNTL